jgi:hypothetical protein
LPLFKAPFVPPRTLRITTGTVALLFKPLAIHPSEQQPYKKFSAPSVLSVDKKWVVGVYLSSALIS